MAYERNALDGLAGPNATQGAIYAGDRQKYAQDAAVPVPQPPLSEQIQKQVAMLHRVLEEIEKRAESTARKLGYGAEDCADKQSPPSRSGVLGSIADQLDATEPTLRRIIAHLDFTARQV